MSEISLGAEDGDYFFLTVKSARKNTRDYLKPPSQLLMVFSYEYQVPRGWPFIEAISKNLIHHDSKTPSRGYFFNSSELQIIAKRANKS